MNVDMTTEEFDKTEFRGNQKIKYKDNFYTIMSIDFEERLIAFNIESDDGLKWVRCENIQLH